MNILENLLETIRKALVMRVMYGRMTVNQARKYLNETREAFRLE